MKDLEISTSENRQKAAETLQIVLDAMEKITDTDRQRIWNTVAVFYGIGTSIVDQDVSRGSRQQASVLPRSSDTGHSFSEDRSQSPKEFLLDKQPSTDVERVACLAYYLTHFRDLQHFKTIDISKLNTEAAQRKFSNAAKAVDNAARGNYLVPSTKGKKQLSAAGELFVEALPDKFAARQAVADITPSKRRGSKKPKSPKSARGC